MRIQTLLPVWALTVTAGAEPPPRNLQAAAAPPVYQHQPPQPQYAYQQPPVYQQQAVPVRQEAVPVQQMPPQAVPVRQEIPVQQVPPQAVPVQAQYAQAVDAPPQGHPIPVQQAVPMQQAVPNQQGVPVAAAPGGGAKAVPMPPQPQVKSPQMQHVNPQFQGVHVQHQQVPPQAYPGQQAPPYIPVPPHAQMPPMMGQAGVPVGAVPRGQGQLPQQVPVNAEFVQAVPDARERPTLPPLPQNPVYGKAPPVIPMDNKAAAYPQPYDGNFPERTTNVTTENLAAQWEQVMQDFMPDMIVTFRLQSAESEYFHIDVDETAPLIRGGFFESSDGKPGSGTFSVVGPDGKLLYGSKQGEGLFSINAEAMGTYTFGMVAAPWSGTKFVTFVLGTGRANRLTTDEVQTIEGRIQAMYRQVQVVESQAQYLWVRQQNMLKEMNNTASQTYYALMLELLCTASATALAAMFVKRTVAKRGVL